MGRSIKKKGKDQGTHTDQGTGKGRDDMTNHHAKSGPRRVQADRDRDRDQQAQGGTVGGGASAGTVQTGTVKRLVEDRGFGFIRTTQGLELFFHRSAVLSTGGFNELREGDRVTFVQGAGSQKGPRAEEVTLLPPPASASTSTSTSTQA